MNRSMFPKRGPRALSVANARAVKAERRARELVDADRQSERIAKENAAKAGPSEPSASDRAKSEVERLLRRR